MIRSATNEVGGKSACHYTTELVKDLKWRMFNLKYGITYSGLKFKEVAYQYKFLKQRYLLFICKGIQDNM